MQKTKLVAMVIITVGLILAMFVNNVVAEDIPITLETENIVVHTDVYDFTLSNPKIVDNISMILEDKTNEKLKKDLLAVSEVGNITISGPYPIYSIDDEGEITQTLNEYFVRFDDEQLSRITISVSDSGNITSTYMIVNDFYEGVNDEPHIVIGTYEEAYVVTANEIYPWGFSRPEVIGWDNGEPIYAESEFNILEIVNEIGQKLFEASINRTYSLSELYARNAELQNEQVGIVDNNETVTTGEVVGIELPHVYQYEGPVATGFCGYASLASLVRYRNPNTYGSLTAEQVWYDAVALNTSYNTAASSIVASNLENILHSIYLVDDGSYSYDYNGPMTWSATSYKGLVDNGRIMIGIFGSSSRNIHAVAMGQYQIMDDDTIRVLVMDPNYLEESETEVYCDWKNSDGQIEDNMIIHESVTAMHHRGHLTHYFFD